MYTLISALVEPLNGNSRWVAAEIGQLTMTAIFARYANVRAVLTNPYLTHPVSLDLALLRAAYGDRPETFNALLASLGNTALPTVDEVPVLNPRYARYADAIHAGYKVGLVHPLYAPDAQLPRSELTWLRLTRAKTDYAVFHKYCLVSVNGFYHQTDSDSRGIFVKEGGTSLRVSNQNLMGILSFRQLGALRQIPITKAMLFKQSEYQSWRHRVCVDIGEDITNKTVMLVLGGYLHVYDAKTFYRNGDRSVTIDIQNLPLYERYLESREFIDLSGLPIERTAANDSLVGTVDFFKDATIEAYLTLSQSFFVILDTPNIFVNRVGVRPSKLPGLYTSYVRPDYPLILGYGRAVNYWTTVEDGQYSLSCVPCFKPNRVINTISAPTAESLTDHRLTQRPVDHSQGYLLQIGKDF